MPANPASESEGVARVLRHEVGDLLQSVYAAVAVLRERLPAEWTTERGILSDLRLRAERTRDFIDLVLDLVGPLTLTPGAVDLAELAAGLTAAAAPRFPGRDVRAETAPTPPLEGDPRRLVRMGTMLIGYACETSPGKVRVRTGPGPTAGEVVWEVLADQGAIPADHLEAVTVPFGKPGHAGTRLMLPLARRLAEAHGGRLGVENAPGGGFALRVTLPVRSPTGPG